MKMTISMPILCLLILGMGAQSPAQVRPNDAVRLEVFKELSTCSAVPSGYADLRVTANFKTHPAGVYSASDLHGTPAYRLQVTIDGQEAVLRGTLSSETSGSPNWKGPESGSGVRYRLANTMRLRGGVHRISVALPDDRVVVERAVTLKSGEPSSLLIEPVYRKRQVKTRLGMGSAESFTEGIKTFKLILNGKEL